MNYFDEVPERGSWSGEDGTYRPCDEPGPYGTRCTLRPLHDYSCYDASDDSSFTHRWRDEGPEDDDDG